MSTLPCRHCGKPIEEGERLVNWPWIHANGFYQCALVDASTKAEPEGGVIEENESDRAAREYEARGMFPAPTSTGAGAARDAQGRAARGDR